MGRIRVAHEELGNGHGTSGQERPVGAELGEAERFPRLAWTQFNQMVVALHQGDHAHQIEQLDTLGDLGMGGLIPHSANQHIDPLIAGKLSPPGEILFQVDMTHLDGV